MTKMISLLMGNNKKVMSQIKLIIMRVMLIEYWNRASCMKTTLLTKMSIVAKNVRLDHTQKTLSTFMVYWTDKRTTFVTLVEMNRNSHMGFTPDNNDQEKMWKKISKILLNVFSLSQINSMTVVRTVDFHHNEDLWGNQMFDHVVGSSVGCSGGSLCMRNPNMFVKEQVSTCDYFVALMGTWAPTSSKLLIISVYAPQELNERRDLWDYLRTFIDRWEGDTVIMGDFNEVRSEHERFGYTFTRQGDIAFNNFISSTCLNDLPLEGYGFAWAHKSASKMSKLDHYLISEGVLDLFPHLFALSLDRHLSDHRHILSTNYDYGPSPFRLFHSWFAMEGFNSFVKTTWKSLNIVEPNGLIRLKKKLQALKIAIKAWSKEANKRVKNEFFTHFKKQFSPIQAPSICFDFTFTTCLSSDQVQDLERTVTYEEVKRAVWDCGTNKSPGPNRFSFEFYLLIPKIQDAKFVKDFRPISLIGSVYKIIAKFLANRLCVVLPYLISDVQSAFVANRQILDGPFILHEILSWCEFKKLNGMIFRVDFEKAFDYVKWDYLDETLKAFGFGSKWRNWISSCLNNAMGSVLINDSPNLEFQFLKGLQQGDLISPFLFILIMETLHLTFKRVLNAGLYKGVSLNDSFTISHLFYPDDVVFIGLKINLYKSKLMRIGVSSNVVAAAASLIGCSILTAPFNYLGGRLSLLKSVLTSIPLYHMSIFKVPIDVLSHLESIRWNFFYGVDGSDRKLAWIGWNMVLTSKNNGVLGVSSFFAHNRALLFKWVWIFLTDGSSLWTRFIKAIFGNKGSLDTHKLIPRRSPWMPRGGVE
nr:RNA-directed DNA polymerase, eukaryota [Tanacetum cinerariifolium]